MLLTEDVVICLSSFLAARMYRLEDLQQTEADKVHTWGDHLHYDLIFHVWACILFVLLMFVMLRDM